MVATKMLVASALAVSALAMPHTGSKSSLAARDINADIEGLVLTDWLDDCGRTDKYNLARLSEGKLRKDKTSSSEKESSKGSKHSSSEEKSTDKKPFKGKSTS